MEGYAGHAASELREIYEELSNHEHMVAYAIHQLEI